MDLSILLWIQQYLANPILDIFFIIITKLGDYGLIWIALIITLLLRKETRSFGILCLIALLSEFILNDLIIKPLVARNRPFVDFNYALLIKAPSGFSFPSGHTASSFTMAFMFYRHNQPAKKVVLALAGLIAFSRLYLFVHYPSDVVVGILVALIVAFCVTQMNLAFQKRQSQ